MREHPRAFADQAYVDQGADDRHRAMRRSRPTCSPSSEYSTGTPSSPDRERLRPGQVVIGMAAPLAAPEVAAAVADRGAVLFALELVPRTTRAQSMDVLSSQANIAGYKAVLLAAAELPKMAPMLTTAAGTIAPAKVFVIGAGVAGLSAIATARRLGAVVEAYDVRTAVKEEVQSLGARFVELPLETGQEGGGSGAYATQMSDEQIAKQRELMAKTIAGSDVVITTAQVQGAKAPVLVTTEMVAGMSPGSVIVDLAAEQGGNCEGSVAGETVEVGGVTIIGTDQRRPPRVPHDASLTYAKNVANFVALIVAGQGPPPGRRRRHRAGDRHHARRRRSSTRACARRSASPRCPPAAAQTPARPTRARRPISLMLSTEVIITSLFIFALAGFLGLEVIRRVPKLLHTPLMALTNALSAISLVGSHR